MADVAIVHLGCPGHFCAVSKCHWRRHTQIGDSYRVSTIGNYFPVGASERETLGAEPNAFFETMVFSTFPSQEVGNEGCGCRVLQGLDAVCTRRYPTPAEAQAGHDAVVALFAELAKTEAR